MQATPLLPLLCVLFFGRHWLGLLIASPPPLCLNLSYCRYRSIPILDLIMKPPEPFEGPKPIKIE